MKLAQTISRFIEMANCAECKTDPEKPPFPELKLSLQQGVSLSPVLLNC
jgi:hypothetical protein